jgi:hypothetical protein
MERALIVKHRFWPRLRKRFKTPDTTCFAAICRSGRREDSGRRIHRKLLRIAKVSELQ